MSNLSNKVKGHAKQILNVSPKKVAKGTVSLVSTITKMGLQGIGAGVYVANTAVKLGVTVSKAAYNEAKTGYSLLSTPKPQAVKREPQQMDMFDEA